MKTIEKYFPSISEIQKEQFNKLSALYGEWNEKINVISRKDIDQLYLRHVLHSLAIAQFIKFQPGTKVLDVGTGGGFPGIPLAIMFPESDFVLIDSIGKKIKVVEGVYKSLGLKNCIALQTRAEEFKDKFDFVVSRAVTNLPLFISWTKKNILLRSKNKKSNGFICLKGGDLKEELRVPFQTEIVEIADYFEEDFFESKKIVHLAFK